MAEKQLTLQEIADYLRAQAAKYSYPEERDYRDGIRWAASVLEQIAAGRFRV